MRYFKRAEIKIPISFLIVSTLWIVFSDNFLLTIQRNLTAFQIIEAQTIKGCLYVGAVSILIHLMIKSANKKLTKSQEEYRDLFYNMPNPMLILNDKTNKFSHVNKAALTTYGYSNKEFSEMSPEDVRADADSNNRFFVEACTIYRHKTKNNDSIICTESTRKISFKNAPATLLAINDITALEKAKAELFQRENLLNQILTSITDGFFILSHALVIEKANDLFKRMAKFCNGKVEGQNLLDLFPTVIESGSYNQYMKAIETRLPVHFESNYKKIKKWYHVSAYPYDAGLSVFFRDITKEKEDELQRQQNEQNLLALINNTEDLIWSVDCNFTYFIFNEPYKQNYKQAFEEEVYVGKCALNEKKGIGHLKKWKSLYERALNGEKFTIDMEWDLGNKRHLTTIQFNPIYDTNHHIIGAGCFLQDITERKLHETRIEQQNEQLKQIAFITSHKVRVPLANILGLTEILDIENPLNPANCKVIEHLKTSAKQLDQTIIDMVQQTVHAND